MGNFWQKASGLVLGLLLFSDVVGSETIISCASISDVTKRLACYDAMAGRVEKKMAEAKAPAVSTQKRIVIRQAAAAVVIGDIAETDGFRVVRVIWSRTLRATYVADDGRRFSDQSSRRYGLKKGDLVELKAGFLGSKRLVRSDGFQVKVKEVTR
jgi:hypothetical protein|tara:strand:- start:3704 stop:4168 length:465 start_codon:yes stop_codon:yes gene_type:complete